MFYSKMLITKNEVFMNNLQLLVVDFFNAVSQSNYAKVEKCLKSEPGLISATTSDQQTPLMMAAENKDKESQKVWSYLLGKCSDSILKKRDRWGCSVLNYAIRANDYEKVKSLLVDRKLRTGGCDDYMQLAGITSETDRKIKILINQLKPDFQSVDSKKKESDEKSASQADPKIDKQKQEDAMVILSQKVDITKRWELLIKNLMRIGDLAKQYLDKFGKNCDIAAIDAFNLKMKTLLNDPKRQSEAAKEMRRFEVMVNLKIAELEKALEPTQSQIEVSESKKTATVSKEERQRLYTSFITNLPENLDAAERRAEELLGRKFYRPNFEMAEFYEKAKRDFAFLQKFGSTDLD